LSTNERTETDDCSCRRRDQATIIAGRMNLVVVTYQE
jgi:hypothetical protein